MHKIKLLAIGKTSENYLETGIQEYAKRVEKFVGFKTEYIADVPNGSKFSKAELKKKEGELFLKKIPEDAYVILLDDKGKTYTSLQFSEKVNQYLQKKEILFIIGGAYGFSDAMYARANEKFSLSSLTFSHQIIRLIFMEQLYRAFSILNNQPYHHE